MEFAAILDDLENPRALNDLPKFHTYLVKKKYKGEPYALGMHPAIFKKIANQEKEEGRFMNIKTLPDAFYNFLVENEMEENSKGQISINVAGKNVARFDVPFLEEKVNWKKINFRHRMIDPSILYYQVGDKTLPDSKTCLQRAGFPEEVSHTALEDALMVIKLIRYKML